MIWVKFSGGCTNSLQLSLLLSMGMSKEHQGQYLPDADVAKTPTTRPGTAMVRRLRSRWRSMVTGEM
jgi:hypothetical protein